LPFISKPKKVEAFKDGMLLLNLFCPRFCMGWLRRGELVTKALLCICEGGGPDDGN